MPSTRMLTTKEAAPRLGITPVRLSRMLAAKQLAGAKYGTGTKARFITRHTH